MCGSRRPVKLVGMRKYTRTLLTGITAVAAFAALTACSTETPSKVSATTTAPASATATPFPQSAKYIADMEAEGHTMTIGVAVNGTEIAAYACNGTDDEAWFFGTQNAGNVDITSKFRDTLEASFDGTDVKGDLTMNGVKYTFTAASVPAPAGMYTAELDGVRASWVMRPNGSAVGVQLNGTGARNFEQAELQQLREDQFRAEVRNKRILQQAAQLTRLQDGQWGSTINGHPVVAQIVDGNFRF
jgi:hypothetical protein